MMLSRARLRADAPASALAPLLGRPAPAHHLVWSLFAAEAGQQRDFLFREEAPGRFLILSARIPQDLDGVFELDEAKPFRPALEPGDRLAFVLRANPRVQPLVADGEKPKKVDVVMHALRHVPRGAARAEARDGVVQQEGLAWLQRRGEAAGFTVQAHEMVVDAYETWRIPRPGSMKPMRFSTLDYRGLLTVRDPARFVPALCAGFGGARGFGCGLMLVRRAV